MALGMGNFYLIGPTYLTHIDWNNLHHRMSIAASLVNSVYTLESDRQQNRQGSQALAPAWWEFFNFELTRTLEDERDKSIFGAIFKFSPNHIGQCPPKYVIAFRGTVNKPENVVWDYMQNFQIFFNKIKKSPRVQAGMEAAKNIVDKFNGPENIWLAGHSAGSSLALQIGRNMEKSGHHLETYLFNPPFPSLPIDLIKDKKLKNGLRLGKNLFTAVLAGGHQNDSFIELSLSTWVPYLFVNSLDPICSSYIGYFEDREKMNEKGFGKIGNISTQHSVKSIMSKAIGKDSEPIHLLPSAHLTINNICEKIREAHKKSIRKKTREAHEVQQWWKPDLQIEYKLYVHK